MPRREEWTEDEQQRFHEAVQLYGKDWKKIEAHIGTRSVIQIRSFAKKQSQTTQETQPEETGSTPAEPSETVAGRKRKSGNQQQVTTKKARGSTAQAPWGHTDSFLYNPSLFTKSVVDHPEVVDEFVCSPELQHEQNELLQRAEKYIDDILHQLRARPPPLSGPNFYNIYLFLKSLFYDSENHSQKLTEMSAIDRETVQLLMHNLTFNLASSQFRGQHLTLLDQYRTYAAAHHNDFDLACSQFPASSFPILDDIEHSFPFLPRRTDEEQ